MTTTKCTEHDLDLRELERALSRDMCDAYRPYCLGVALLIVALYAASMASIVWLVVRVLAP